MTVKRCLAEQDPRRDWRKYYKQLYSTNCCVGAEGASVYLKTLQPARRTEAPVSRGMGGRVRAREWLVGRCFMELRSLIQDTRAVESLSQTLDLEHCSASWVLSNHVASEFILMVGSSASRNVARYQYTVLVFPVSVRRKGLLRRCTRTADR